VCIKDGRTKRRSKLTDESTCHLVVNVGLEPAVLDPKAKFYCPNSDVNTFAFTKVNLQMIIRWNYARDLHSDLNALVFPKDKIQLRMVGSEPSDDNSWNV
jgi:hypothetical protein